MIDIKRMMEVQKDKASVWQDSERFRTILAVALLEEASALGRTSGLTSDENIRMKIEQVQIYRLADSLLGKLRGSS